MTFAAALPRIEPTQNADEVARALVELFEAVEGIPLKVSWVQRETERRLVDDGHPALAAAARTIAQAIDAEAVLHDARPYHSRQHFCEVMLAACVLCQLHGLRGRPAQFLLLAALVHDFEHDGRSNQEFRLERASVTRATPHLLAAGVGADARERLAALVLATEPHHGVRAARLAREFHATGAISPPRFGDPAELRLLTGDAELSQLAMLLCEADVLPSVGLTFAHALRLQRLLATEWGRHLGSSDKLVFIDEVLAAGVIGPFFLPNVAAIRLEVARHIDEPG
jgi:hypothetical protein